MRPQPVRIPEEDKEGIVGRVHRGTAFWKRVTREDTARSSWFATVVNWARKDDILVVKSVGST